MEGDRDDKNLVVRAKSGAPGCIAGAGGCAAGGDAMTGRDAQGRFTPGNQIAHSGWAGLVQRRFAGDEATAKLWVGQLGRWAYAKQFAGHQTPMMAYRAATCYAHPGQPEQYRQRFEFTLADIEPLAF
jgi:hypothetical protein